jgi:YHS domain-containing protein
VGVPRCGTARARYAGEMEEATLSSTVHRRPRQSGARDPVCGTTVRRSRRTLSGEYAGITYSFCSQECLERFTEDPDIFTAGARMGAVAIHDRASRPASEYAGKSTMGEHAVVGPAPVVDAGPGCTRVRIWRWPGVLSPERGGAPAAVTATGSAASSTEPRAQQSSDPPAELSSPTCAAVSPSNAVDPWRRAGRHRESCTRSPD